LEEAILIPEALPERLPAISVECIAWHGWADCCRLGNGSVEAVVAPSVGRVMSLKWMGEELFWSNPALRGSPHGHPEDEWKNFGGDKCWPAPQSDWPLMQALPWPPPAAFDAKPFRAEQTETGVRLLSEVDPGYGIQVERQIELLSDAPGMRIRTVFHKVTGPPVSVSVWTITQMPEPERVALLLAGNEDQQEGYLRLIETEPHLLRRAGRVLSFARHPREFVKVGVESLAMAWIGAPAVVRIESLAEEADAGSEFPDGGCRSEIYSNPGELAYVELETLGPLVELKSGESTGRTALYKIGPRTTADADEEARRALQTTAR
jgi:hypothetical protein